jgi:hypothetical protein
LEGTALVHAIQYLMALHGEGMRARFLYSLAVLQIRNARDILFFSKPFQESAPNMPAFYNIDKDRKLVMSSGAGKLTADDLMGHQDRLLKDPDFDPTYSQVIDLTHITEHHIEPEDVRDLAKRNVFSSTSRRAIVVQDDLQYGLARMFEIHRDIAGETGIRVFRDLDEALNWIFTPTQAA